MKIELWRSDGKIVMNAYAGDFDSVWMYSQQLPPKSIVIFVSNGADVTDITQKLL